MELILAGDVEASISAAREDVYARPGAKPEVRFSTIMEDLRRRDFSINAIAISLNANSRGLLLDPTNGLADLERREIRALSIHSFTNQPVRLLARVALCGAHGFQDGFAHRGVVQPGAWSANCRKPSLRKMPAASCGKWRARKNRSLSSRPGKSQ